METSRLLVHKLTVLYLCLFWITRVCGNNATTLQQALNKCLNEPLLKPHVEWQGGLTGQKTVQWGLENVCTSINTCYGAALPAELDTKLDYQQPPVFVQPGVQVRFNSSAPYTNGSFIKLNFFEVDLKSFESADSSRGIPLTTSGAADSSVTVPLKIGTSYYLANSSQTAFLNGRYGLRLMLTVQTSNCSATSLSLPCSSKGRCTAEPWQPIFTCRCCLGYTGPHCAENDGCWSSPCLHAGTCVDGIDTGRPFTCICQQGYSGATCDQVVATLCKTNLCLNEGVCLQGQGSNFTCGCPSTFTGPRCETRLTACDNKPCLNGGTCVVSPTIPTSYTCSCLAGFSGRNCESDIKKCPVNICMNGGECIQFITGPVCNCLQGFTGPDCSTRATSLCIPNPCQNAIECVEYPNYTFKCTCKPGYSGQYCNIDTNECASNPCSGGNCTDTVAGYACRCPTGRSGLYCEVSGGSSVAQQLIPVEGGQSQLVQALIITAAVVGSLSLIAALAVGLYFCITRKACCNNQYKAQVDEYTPAGYTGRVSTVSGSTMASDRSAYERAMDADNNSVKSPSLLDNLISRDSMRSPLVSNDSGKQTFHL